MVKTNRIIDFKNKKNKNERINDVIKYNINI